MKPFAWRTRDNSYVYVDSFMGDDLNGDGTQANPYKTLGKAYRGRGTKPATIVCRGRFCEDMADGNHSTTIRGDYMGAAVFDGEDTYLIYGFGHINMIIENCAEATPDLLVNTGSALLAGVGRASYASHVGNASAVDGVAGSSALVGKSPLYFGCIGGSTAVKYVGIWKPKLSGGQKLWYGGAGDIEHMTVYDVPIEIMMKSRYVRTLRSCVFAKCEFFADDPLKFENCVFTADCQWYTSGGDMLDQEGTSGQDRLDLLLGEMGSYGIAEANRPKFTNCIFTKQTAAELLNNPEAGDLTLRPTSDAITGPRQYIGGFAPAINLPILDNSQGVAESWDEQSASGLLKVNGNAICMDETSSDAGGEILSKVVKIDTSKMAITGVFSKYDPKWGMNGVHLSDEAVKGIEYSPGAVLPVGRYIVKGAIIYKNTNYPDGMIVGVTEDGTTFMQDPITTGSKLIAIENPNITNICYIRSTPVMFAQIKSVDGLERGGIYYNFGTQSIQYRGRTIAPGESFVAVNNTDKFTAPSGNANYLIGVMFDDSRVPSQEWIPAQLFGEYFVYKNNGVIQLDTEDKPISSGNYLSFQTAALGGYSDKLRKSMMTERYCQFKIIASKQ